MGKNEGKNKVIEHISNNDKRKKYKTKAMHIDFFELIKLKTDTERLAALNSVHYSDWNTVMLWAEEAADPHARAIFERKAKDLAIREKCCEDREW